MCICMITRIRTRGYAHTCIRYSLYIETENMHMPLITYITQGNPISGYRRLRDFGGKQMTSSSDRVCTYPFFFIAYILFI